MANFTALKTAINNAIKTNGNEEITGAILQAILDAMVETLGDSAINDLENAITTEVTNRENAVGGVADNLAAEVQARQALDYNVNNRINAEEYNRQNADAALSQTMNQGFQTLGSQMTALNAAISALNAAYQNGYLYGGIATPSSSPSNNKCFYIALQGGTYTNFGGVGVVEGINIIRNDSGWKVEHIYDQTTLLNEFYLLRQQVIQAITSFDPIVIEGDVTNAPDEEDLTSNANHLLQFKNNAYSPLEFSGLGRKYLRKNIAPLSESAPFNGFVEGVTAEATLSGTPTQIFWDRMNTRFVGIKNGVYYLDWTGSDNYVPVSTSLVYMYNGTPYQWTGSDFIVDETEVPNLVNCLTQDMINEANTIYIIRYDYTLKEDITIPANCVLQFDGGSISGEHTITGASTNIIAPSKNIFGSGVIIAGSWIIPIIFASWFYNEDNTLKKVSKLLNGDCYNKLIINEDYNFDLDETDPEYTPSSPQDTNQGDNGLKIPSNTDVELNGTITITPNAYPCYHIIDINGGENISIKGVGSVIGDKYQHTYDSTIPWLGAQEWGNALYIRNAKNVLVDGIEFKETTGNGVVADAAENVTITNCNIHHNRKLCISVTEVDNLLIIDNYLHDIGGDTQDTAQSCAIDIESESGNEPMYCSNIVIKGNLIKNMVNPITIIPNNGIFDRIFVENNKFEGSGAGAILLRTRLSDAGVYTKNLVIKNNQVLWTSFFTLFHIECCQNVLIDNNNSSKCKIVSRYCDNILFTNNKLYLYDANFVEIKKSNAKFIGNNIYSDNGSYILNTSGTSVLGLDNTEMILYGNTLHNIMFSDIYNKTTVINNIITGEQKQSTMVDGDVIMKNNIIKMSIASANYAIFDFNNSTKRQVVENNTFIFDAAMNKIFAKGNYTEINNNIIYNTTSNKNSVYGLFADRPNANNIGIGYKYFCTDKQTTEGATDGIEIIHKGSGVWVDALGRVVS